MANATAELSLENDPEVGESVRELQRVLSEQGRDPEIVPVMLHELRQIIAERAPRGRGLTDEQARYLVESGDFTAEELAETERAVADGELALEERNVRLGAISRSLSATEAARRLGVDPSRVRHRQAKGLLYGVLIGGRRRYPEWQFVPGSGDPLPKLGQVIKAFPEDWQLATVESFMTTPKSALRAPGDRNGERLTPVEWLLNGGDPEAIVGILDSFLQS